MIRTRRRGTRDDPAQEAVARTVAVLQGYQRAGADTVPVADVLGMLGASPQEPAPELPARHPQADPLTGCLPAGPA